LASGRLDLKEETFRAMGRAHPELIWPLYELRCVLGKLRLNDLQIGTDGRNRAWLNPFGSRSSRNQPSSNKFIFGPSAWLRCLIKPRPGYAVAYCDYEQQEFAIAAVLSGDDVMLKAYQSADPYLEFGKLAGDIPPEATKKTHGALRARFKQCVLAVQYGQGTRGLATRIPTTCAIAARLLRLNREVFAKFWAWSDHIVDHVMLGNRLYTVLGWQERFMRFGDEDVNPRSVRNFPMQANGAEMMRLACCFAIENGVELVAPVHDGFLIHAPVDQIDEMVSRMCAAMAKASKIILRGFELRVGTDVFRYPERFVDEDRAEPLWSTTMRLLEECEDARAATSGCRPTATKTCIPDAIRARHHPATKSMHPCDKNGVPV
jgi:DNA polymerase family A